MEVNDNQGAPKCEDNQGFVATKMRQLDGTKEFPLKVGEVLVDLRKRYQDHLADQERIITAALAKAGRDALKDAKPTSAIRVRPELTTFAIRGQTGMALSSGGDFRNESGGLELRVPKCPSNG